MFKDGDIEQLEASSNGGDAEEVQQGKHEDASDKVFVSFLSLKMFECSTPFTCLAVKSPLTIRQPSTYPSF